MIVSIEVKTIKTPETLFREHRSRFGMRSFVTTLPGLFGALVFVVVRRRRHAKMDSLLLLRGLAFFLLLSFEPTFGYTLLKPREIVDGLVSDATILLFLRIDTRRR